VDISDWLLGHLELTEPGKLSRILERLGVEPSDEGHPSRMGENDQKGGEVVVKDGTVPYKTYKSKRVPVTFDEVGGIQRAE
jgi:hypothetical protein